LGVKLSEVLGEIGMNQPPLKPLHKADTLIESKLAVFRKLPTMELIQSLAPLQIGALKTKPDGTMMDGHHRIAVLQERGVNVDELPREIVPFAEM